jgi:hypothetical protein
MGLVTILLVITTLVLLLIMLAVTGLVRRQYDAAVTYEPYDIPPVTWKI